MSSEQVVTVAAGAVALVSLLVAVVAILLVRRAQDRVEEARAAVLEVEAQIARLADEPHRRTPGDPQAPADPAFVITDIGSTPAPEEHVHVDGRLFADIVARESAIKAAGLVAGLRRALSAETRHRIRFEVGREVKRSRRQRRAETRAALRAHRARERARPSAEDAA